MKQQNPTTSNLVPGVYGDDVVEAEGAEIDRISHDIDRNGCLCIRSTTDMLMFMQWFCGSSYSEKVSASPNRRSRVKNVS